jgi:predicted DNA-binding protein (MmcQ/YjbR family)
MNVKQLQKFCLSFPGAAERLWPDPYNILVYAVEDKTFAYFKTSDPEKWRFSFKASPDRFVELTGIPGVKPARYRGRYRWVTIVDVASFPPGYLKELVAWSHEEAMGKLSAAKRRALLSP